MPAALWFLLVCDKTVVERVPPPMLSWTLALGLPMLLAGAEPPAPPGAALGPGGIGFCASATPLERASAQAAIVEILSMLVPPFEGQECRRNVACERVVAWAGRFDTCAWHVPCGAPGCGA